MDHLYWLEGSVSVPENRREELNENVLKLLKQSGIRKLKEIQLDGKTITVVHEPKPDDNGIVRFDYSVFEKKKREISLYELPAYLVTAYGWAVQEEFWGTWFSLGIKGYHDIYKEDRSKKTTEKEERTQKQRLFYKIIQRSCEDEFLEFLEFLDHQELCLS